MKFAVYFVVAFCLVQACAAAAIGERLHVAVQEATGIFANIDFLSRTIGDGKNRTLNEIIRDVSEEDDLVDIKYVKLDPEYPKRSTPIHLNALAYVKEPIEAATANIKVKYGIITVLNRDYDLCKELRDNLNKTCPVDEGYIEVDIDVDVPGFVPWGWYHLDATAWRDSDQKQLGHIIANVKF
ncbi:Phosphatidylglycerol/phosphatidylinositol transfer protein [Coemansia spiralis]|uniref:Phosphatidylglycerol/phosphatidylinositol transfer protein n=2 Tax=Coemansia TaxID=4863 RepID=A0A9W8GAM5_9FUNG|nr:hypothetical protein BX070DRAFT_219079 [Coemansia spiralis]KAJ1994776.1 Phosphatidylglycerol/phosphatidylinositol transfer protein [Coemansia umbellata]KAJ2624523.1 Phosphatidylglycerol/phosphatidylinositol transfer protein [Coemansia sp. RSA 1358]KAJ2679511.1 Phosphatidylglycerol/phosphatidylinositol transfer protein [Coemansia spiralis]